MAYAIVAGVAAADQMAWMPAGGRTLLLNAFGNDPARIAGVAGMKHTPEEWRSLVEKEGATLTPVQLDTLASYLALNLPVKNAGSLSALKSDELAAALPPDGKDLAVARCQSCHALFSGYLSHKRDKTGWMQTFQSPFHKEIPMNAVEIETFAAYSALNMPMSFDEVPPEWRF